MDINKGLVITENLAEDNLEIEKPEEKGMLKYAEFNQRLGNDIAFRRLVECAVADGHTDDEIGDLLYIPPSVWVTCVRNRDYQKMTRSIRKQIKTEAIHSARKLANGFRVEERDFITAMDIEKLLEKKEAIKKALDGGKKQELRHILLSCADIDGDKKIKVKVSEKYYPPNKDAVFRILEAYDEETWDKELKRKKIPEKKIVVTVSGDHLKRLNKERIQADFEIEA